MQSEGCWERGRPRPQHAKSREGNPVTRVSVRAAHSMRAGTPALPAVQAALISRASELTDRLSPVTSSALRRDSIASMDHRPGPANNKNAHDASCAYSDRISCSTAQKPICGGTGGSGSGDVPKY